MDTLPTELLSHIFQFLNVSDRKEAALVCSRWYDASQDPALLKDTYVELTTQSLVHQLPASRTHMRYRKKANLVLKDAKNLTTTGLAQGDYKELIMNISSLSLRGTDVTERMFLDILSHCVNLESLDVSNCNGLFMSGQLLAKSEDQERLRGILNNVKELSLGSLRYLTDVTFKRIAYLCPNIEKLSMAGCMALFLSTGYLADAFDCLEKSTILNFSTILMFIKDSAATLKCLDFSMTSINDSALERVARVDGLCLHEIILQSCREITNSGIQMFTSIQQEIGSIDVSWCVDLTNAAVHAICCNLPALRQLNMNNCRQIDNVGIARLRKLCRLQKLEMSSCHTVTSNGMVAGLCDGTLDALVHLDVSCCSSLGDSFVLELCNQMGFLTHLNLGSCFGLSDVGLHHISKGLPRLRFLSVSWCKRITDYGLLGLLPEGYIHHREDEGKCKCTRKSTIEPGTLGKASRLSEVDYPKLSLEDADYLLAKSSDDYAIYNLKVLCDLDLQSCHQITDVGIIRAIHFTELRSLHLPHTVSDTSLRSLATNLPSLEKLYVPQCRRITDEGVSIISRKCHRLLALDISGIDNVTNRSIEALVTYALRLKFIDISLCKNITPECVDMMESTLPNLRTVLRRHVGGSLYVF